MRTRTGYLVRRGKVFYAVWYVAGRKCMRTTRERDRRNAEVELRRIIAPFAAGDELAVLERVKARIEGKRKEVERLEREHKPPLSIGMAWSAFLDSPGRPDSGPVTLGHYEGQFGQFAQWIKQAHPRVEALRDVTSAMAAEYAGVLARRRELSGNTFNKHVRLLELVFRVLKAQAQIGMNPWEGIQRKRSVAQSRRELTVEELKTVCAAAEGELRLMLALGVYTGLRLGDAATVRWAEVDLTRGTISRVPGKTARRNPRPVVIPIHGVLAGILNAIPAADRREYVLPTLAKMQQRDPPALSKRIQAHFRRCGVQTIRPGTGVTIERDENGRPRRVDTGKRAVVEVGFHSLRHTFVSLCRESNAPLAVVEAIVGHANPAMTRHYTHVSELAAARAVNALPVVLGDVSALSAARGPVADWRAAIRLIVEGMTAKTWKQDKARLLALLDE